MNKTEVLNALVEIAKIAVVNTSYAGMSLQSKYDVVSNDSTIFGDVSSYVANHSGIESTVFELVKNSTKVNETNFFNQTRFNLDVSENCIAAISSKNEYNLNAIGTTKPSSSQDLDNSLDLLHSFVCPIDNFTAVCDGINQIVGVITEDEAYMNETTYLL